MQQGTENLEEDDRKACNPKTGRNAKEEEEEIIKKKTPSPVINKVPG
jgi:hypothetical protein